MEKCKSFARYKGVYQPKCNCDYCWELYFTKHPGMQMAVASAIHRFGVQVAVMKYGEKFVKRYINFAKGKYAAQAA